MINNNSVITATQNNVRGGHRLLWVWFSQNQVFWVILSGGKKEENIRRIWLIAFLSLQNFYRYCGDMNSLSHNNCAVKIWYHDTYAYEQTTLARMSELSLFFEIVVSLTLLYCNRNSQKKVLLPENTYWKFNFLFFQVKRHHSTCHRSEFLSTQELWWWSESMKGAFQQSSEPWVITLLRRKTSGCLIKACCGMFLRSSKLLL